MEEKSRDENLEEGTAYETASAALHTPKYYKKLRSYHGILALAATGLLVWFSPVGRILGLYGTGVDELLMLGASVLIVRGAGADVREVFPVRRPTFSGVAGTVILWLASYLGVMIVTLILTFLFPQEMASVSGGLLSAFLSVPFPVLFFIVAILPAICEEAVFRGVLLNSLCCAEGKPLLGREPGKKRGRYYNLSSGRKWSVILITGMIFGIFHGNLLRFFPTAILGVMLGYILMESENMVYNGLFHCINNAIPVMMSYAMKDFYAQMEMGTVQGMPLDALPFLSVGVYLCYGTLIPFFLSKGNYLLHKEIPGYRTKLFPTGKPWIILVLIGCSIFFLLAGIGVIGWSILSEPDILRDFLAM